MKLNEYIWKPINILPELTGFGVSGEGVITNIVPDVAFSVNVEFYFLNVKNMITFDREVINRDELTSAISFRNKFSGKWIQSMVKGLFEPQADRYTKDHTEDFIKSLIEEAEDNPEVKKYFYGS